VACPEEEAWVAATEMITVDGQTIKASDLQPREAVSKIRTSLLWITLLDLKVILSSSPDLDPKSLKAALLSTSVRLV